MNLCIYLKVILRNEEVYTWLKRNVIGDCHNFRGKKEEDDLKKESHHIHMKASLL